jgi:hypothetical protein
MKFLIAILLIWKLCGCAVSHTGNRSTSQFPITGNSDKDRAITYGGIGAATGAILGNQMGGDRSEKRAIGAGVGALTGLILAGSENRRQQDISERQAEREYELENRKAAEERRRDIILGRTVSDAEILRGEHEVEKLENEVARMEQERAAAEARARRIRELKVQKAELEKELGNLKSIK